MAEHPAEDVCCALKSMFNLLEAVKTVRILAN